mmetsp:Transcript_32401/g.52419  ORF Transcript_32401/g.52419 Transcript_32401/m.52419 type:complete len:431 (-) Transcript_32401:27-1319(-)
MSATRKAKRRLDFLSLALARYADDIGDWYHTNRFLPCCKQHESDASAVCSDDVYVGVSDKGRYLEAYGRFVVECPSEEIVDTCFFETKRKEWQFFLERYRIDAIVDDDTFLISETSNIFKVIKVHYQQLRKRKLLADGSRLVIQTNLFDGPENLEMNFELCDCLMFHVVPIRNSSSCTVHYFWNVTKRLLVLAFVPSFVHARMIRQGVTAMLNRLFRLLAIRGQIICANSTLPPISVAISPAEKPVVAIDTAREMPLPIIPLGGEAELVPEPSRENHMQLLDLTEKQSKVEEIELQLARVRISGNASTSVPTPIQNNTTNNRDSSYSSTTASSSSRVYSSSSSTTNTESTPFPTPSPFSPFTSAFTSTSTSSDGTSHRKRTPFFWLSRQATHPQPTLPTLHPLPPPPGSVPRLNYSLESKLMAEPKFPYP